MTVLDNIEDFFESLDTSDEMTDRFIDDEYKGLLQLCLLYAKLDKKTLPLTCLQYLVYVTIISYHWIFGIQGLIETKGVNFVIYSKGAYYFLVIQVAAIVMASAVYYRDALVRFHRSMARNFYDYKETRSEFIEAFRKQSKKEVKMLSSIPISTVIGAVSAFVLSPVLDKYGTYVVEDNPLLNINLPAPIFAYQFSTHNNMGFLLAYVIQICLGTILILIIGGGGYFYIVMVQGIRCQLRILIHSIEIVEERADRRYYEISGTMMRYKYHNKFTDKLYDICYNECLKKNFEHHQVILSMYDCLRQVFSVPVFAAFITGSAVIALSLISNNMGELPGTSLTSTVLGTIEVGYIAFLSYLGQTIIDLNDELRVTMYETKWYYCSVCVKNSIKIFQQETLRPLQIMSAGIVPINLDTFAMVMNTAYSYYNLMNAFSSE